MSATLNNCATKRQSPQKNEQQVSGNWAEWQRKMAMVEDGEVGAEEEEERRKEKK